MEGVEGYASVAPLLFEVVISLDGSHFATRLIDYEKTFYLTLDLPLPSRRLFTCSSSCRLVSTESVGIDQASNAGGSFHFGRCRQTPSSFPTTSSPLLVHLMIVSESLISTVSTQQAGHIRHEPKHTSPAATTHLVTFHTSPSGQNTFRSAIQQISHATASLPSATINALWAAEICQKSRGCPGHATHMLCGRTMQIPSDLR